MQEKTIESGVQLFSRIKKSSEACLSDINSKLFQEGAPNSNEIIEVTGDHCRDLLLDFLIRCILPKELHMEWKGSGVAFINTTNHINILTITTLMDAYLKHLKFESRKSIIEKALSRITLLNCYSQEQIEITFRNLERIIQDRDNINLIIVDDVTSQFWIAKQNNLRLSLDQFSKQNFQMLQSIIKNLDVLLIFSRYQISDLTKPVDTSVDYKIIGEKIDSANNQFTMIDYVKKTSKKVPFHVENFITFI